MRLDSVTSLKTELLNQLVSPVARAEAAGRPRVALALADMNVPMPVGAQPMDNVPQVHRSVALGVAPKGRQYHLAIRVQRPGLLSSPLVDRIVQRAHGEADLRVVGRIDKRAAGHGGRTVWFRGKVRPLAIGASVSHELVTAGSIGAFIKYNGRACILSNNHVLANENQARKGDAVIQPGHRDGGRARQRVAALRSWIQLRGRGSNAVDAALAEIDDGIDYDPALLRGIVAGRDRKLKGIGPKDVDESERVYKIGRTTGATTGRVSAFDVDNVVVNYDLGNLRFDGVIEIEGTGSTPMFSDGGDSGSLILNSQMQAVALLFAGSERGGPRGSGVTYAIPITRVLAKTGGTLLS